MSIVVQQMVSEEWKGEATRVLGRVEGALVRGGSFQKSRFCLLLMCVRLSLFLCMCVCVSA